MIKKLFALTFVLFALSAQTIAEKRDEMLAHASEENQSLTALNEELALLRKKLHLRYGEAHRLLEEEADEQSYRVLVDDVKEIRGEIEGLETRWRDQSVGSTKRGEEGYGLWDQEETTLSQLVMEYGSNDYLYIIPPEMMSMKLDMHSSVPVPRESWNELLEIILSQSGIGIKQLNPYTRQLYILRQNLIAASTVATSKSHLDSVPAHARVIYLFSPEPEHVRGVANFFERFRDPKRTFIYQIAQKVAIVSSKEEVLKLLSLYDAVWEEGNEKVTRVVSLAKTSPQEMEKILKTFFASGTDRGRLTIAKGSGEGLDILPLSHENAIVLIGMKEIVERAERVIVETEAQVDDPTEMTVYWYNVRHSDPLDLSDVLEKVYDSLVGIRLEGMPASEGGEGKKEAGGEVDDKSCNQPQYGMNQQLPTYGPPPCPPVVQPPVVQASTTADQKRTSKTKHFIPYQKSGSIMMVVRKDTLSKLKELLRKLDVPKKMVEIEVLLFEKIIQNKDEAGLNILKLGSAASNTHATGFDFNASRGTGIPGLIDFFISRTKSGSIPAYDLAFNFLMTQDNIRINASPSVTTVNQTPAQISIVEELSINNGAAPLETQTGITFESSFTRAQFGITLVVTPTIHEPDPDKNEDEWSVSMDTQVNFDTTLSDVNDRPKVNRREIKNFVRVNDGQTIILGGLRRKTGEDKTEKIPFLGEIPGIAKLFGNSKMQDELTEMFMFITPRIIQDPKYDAERLRDEMLMRRAGDVPEFLDRVIEAQKAHKRKVFSRSWNLIFGNDIDSNFYN